MARPTNISVVGIWLRGSLHDKFIVQLLWGSFCKPLAGEALCSVSGAGKMMPMKEYFIVTSAVFRGDVKEERKHRILDANEVIYLSWKRDEKLLEFIGIFKVCLWNR